MGGGKMVMIEGREYQDNEPVPWDIAQRLGGLPASLPRANDDHAGRAAPKQRRPGQIGPCPRAQVFQAGRQIGRAHV